MSTAAPPRTTPRGTPCAVSWDAAWVAQVAAREQALDRRVCGARTVGGTPCPLPSDHASGRCRHHGGFTLTGAPADNRNAVVHGLYSRRLMICGSHCPAWQSCPLGGGSAFSVENGGPSQRDAGDSFLSFPRKREPLDESSSPVEGGVPAFAGMTSAERPARQHAPRPVSYGQYLLKLPLADRPQCTYEVAEYNAVVTDVMKRACANADNAFGLHLAHQIALITVMVSRAARALAIKPFTEKMEQSAENYYMSVDKPSAALVAFEKLSRELRRWIAMLEQHYGGHTIANPTAREHELRQRVDTAPDPDGLATLDLTSALAQKKHTRETAARNAELDEIDRQIVDSLFARFKVKPQNPLTTENMKDTEKGQNINPDGPAKNNSS